MPNEQHIVALIANLIEQEDVSPESVERAVSGALDLKVGDAICQSPLTRAFVNEQLGRLEQGKSDRIDAAEGQGRR